MNAISVVDNCGGIFWGSPVLSEFEIVNILTLYILIMLIVMNKILKTIILLQYITIITIILLQLYYYNYI